MTVVTEGSVPTQKHMLRSAPCQAGIQPYSKARDPRPILSKSHNDRSIDRWKGKEEMELHIFVLPFAKQLAGRLCGIAGQGAVQPADNLLREGVNRSLAVALLLWLVKSAKRCSGSTPNRSSLVWSYWFLRSGHITERVPPKKQNAANTDTRNKREKRSALMFCRPRNNASGAIGIWAWVTSYRVVLLYFGTVCSFPSPTWTSMSNNRRVIPLMVT